MTDSLPKADSFFEILMQTRNDNRFDDWVWFEMIKNFSRDIPCQCFKPSLDRMLDRIL